MAPQTHGFLYSMVDTGEFSDFTLVCDGHEFKLHQVLVCPQSPVIAAALCGGFQEATSKIITVNEFDISTVRYMIPFLYTGGYRVETESQGSPIPSDEQFQDEADSSSPSCPESESMKDENADTILSHLRVNAIADYYNVGNLAQLANSKIEAILKQGQKAESFPPLLQEMSKSNRDESLCAIVASATAGCMRELIKLQDFQDLELEHALVLKIFHFLTKEIDKVQNQLDDSQQLSTYLGELAATQEHVDIVPRHSDVSLRKRALVAKCLTSYAVAIVAADTRKERTPKL